MSLGLSVSDIVNVTVQLTPVGAQQRNFGSLLILGDTDNIDVVQRYRLYTSLQSIGADSFGTTSPEYLAAKDFFGQLPQPQQVYLGRWASTNASGLVRGVALTPAQQSITNFNSIISGGVNFTVDGNAKNLAGLNFTAQTNLNGVAAVIQAAFAGSASVIWDSNNSQFVVKSSTSGNASSVTFATPGSGTDISGLLGLRSTQGGYTVAGLNAETVESAVNTFLALTNAWYGLTVAATNVPLDADLVNVAGIIQASSPSHIFGCTTQETAAYNPASTTDLGALLQSGGYSRTFCQYSSTDPYAAASIFGRAFTVNFNGSNTVITLKFEAEPTVQPETLTETQAAALTAKNINVYVNYNNSTMILQQGTMANGFFFDEVHGTDWLQNQIQTDIYNALIATPTKIPQTDAGIGVLAAVVAQDCAQAVTNGLVAPGVWTGPPIGALQTGQMLSTGFYVFQPPIASQSAAARTARQSPVIQAAIKFAGAVHFANVLVSVNR